MSPHVDLTLLLGGMALAIAFAANVLFNTTLRYRKWARVAAIVAAVAALFWGSLGLLLFHSTIPLSTHAFGTLRHIKFAFALLSIGLVLTLVAVRPYQKIDQRYD